MKTSKYIKWLLSTTVALMMSSCLDFEPQQQLSDDTYWTTPSEYQLWSNNFYGWIRTYASATEYRSEKPQHSDYYSDLFTNKDQRNLYSNGTNPVPAADGNYGSNYSHIRRCNILLRNAKTYPSPDDIATYVGEAHFFRAYCYFDLLQLYGDAIIVEEPLEVGDPKMKVARNDRSDVTDFIIRDLKDAIELLPKARQITEEGRISSEAAEAFLSRVALYEGTWQKFRNNESRGKELLDIAAKAAYNVIQSGSYQLFKSSVLGNTSLKYLFILENAQCNPAGLTKKDNHEYIISRRYDEVESPINSNVTQSMLYNAVWINKKFADMYLCQNGLPITYGGQTNPQFKGYAKIDSEFENRDNRMATTMMRPHDNFWNNVKSRTTWDGKDKNPFIADFKPTAGTGYHNQKWAVERSVKDKYEGFDWPVLRYAEVLLNYAEAVYERDDKISDADLDLSLNQVRLRVNPDMKRLSNALITGNPGMDMRTEIRRERTIELFNEGFRLDDLKRWKTAEDEMPQDILGITWKGTEYEKTWPSCPYSPNADGAIVIETNRRWAEKNYLFPLPTDQLQLNPNLKQNPGWN